MKARGVAHSPFTVASTTFADDFTNTAGRTVVSPPDLVGGESTGVILIISESLFTNRPAVAAYTPTNAAKVQQINIYNGVLYRAVDPLLGIGGGGGSGGGIAARFADLLINAGWRQRIILIHCGVGGTKIQDWSPPNGAYAHRWAAGILRARQYGFPISAVLFGVGINDGIAGTSQVNWQNGFLAMVAGIRGMGCNAPILLCSECRTGASTISSTILAAQAAMISAPNGVLAGADINSLSGANLSDGIHLDNATGMANGAVLIRDNIIARVP